MLAYIPYMDPMGYITYIPKRIVTNDFSIFFGGYGLSQSKIAYFGGEPKIKQRKLVRETPALSGNGVYPQL